MALLNTDPRYWRPRYVARSGCNIARLLKSTHRLLGAAVPPVTVLLTDAAPAASPEDPPAAPPIPPTPVLGPTKEGPSIADIDDLHLPPPLLGSTATLGAKRGLVTDDSGPLNLNTPLGSDRMDGIREVQEAVSAGGLVLKMAGMSSIHARSSAYHSASMPAPPSTHPIHPHTLSALAVPTISPVDTVSGVYVDAYSRLKSDPRPSPHNDTHAILEHIATTGVSTGNTCPARADNEAQR
ncbi:hypothetical protein C8Q76DRAFT_792790 [Earliella scabrosa]|nr:hypothetical protein C8Q76DRAFT_792790 [Earliella scabrosa]